MRTDICELLGIEIPLVAFSHCRDVVVEVSKAGGFGMLGGSGFTPDELEQELAWIDEHIGGKPYGVDVILPEKLDVDVAVAADALLAMVPLPHQDFVVKILDDHGIEFAREQVLGMLGGGLSAEAGEALLDVTLRHPVKLVANALGVPPAYVVERSHAAGIPVAALVGAKEHALRQVEAGVDVIVAQGGEAGGHCGEVSTMVLVPEVVRAVDGSVPVLAAGGIVTGEQMAAPWTVSKMLAATSRDTVRSRARTGKPSRQLRSTWHDAWEGAGSPGALPMPLQTIVSEPALRHVDKLAESGHDGARDLATYWVGQGVGLMDKRRHARDVLMEMASAYVDTVERLTKTLD